MYSIDDIRYLCKKNLAIGVTATTQVQQRTRKATKMDFRRYYAQLVLEAPLSPTAEEARQDYGQMLRLLSLPY